MRADIDQKQTPEGRELQKKRAELSRIEAELAGREVERATLQAELRAFECQYLLVVGNRYVELDEINARIAEFTFRADPKNEDARKASADARTRADESEHEVRGM